MPAMTWERARAENPGLTAEVTSDGMLCRSGSRAFLAGSPEDASQKLAGPLSPRPGRCP